MGWNTGFAIFEETVIGAYDLGKLDKDLLFALMVPYSGTDIDSGGSRDLETNDGKRVQQVVIEAYGWKCPKLPDNPTDKQFDNYYDKLYDKFHKITNKMGWS